MAANSYHFITHWKVPASCKEVYDVLSDAESLKRWWPSVYLGVKITKQGDENNVGKEVSVFTKGWLPYTLRWSFIVVDVNKPYGFTIKAKGDLEGVGAWEFKQSGDDCLITFDWKLDAEKPFLKTFSFFLKPAFEANHKWAMKKGEESLLIELKRRHATHEELRFIASPPRATFRFNKQIL